MRMGALSRRRASHLCAAILACGAGTLGAGAIASAAVVSGTGAQPVFTAGAGETNNLRVSLLPDRITTYFDDDVPITTTSPDCGTVLGNVTCLPPVTPPFINIQINLLDGNDQTTLTGVTVSVSQNGGEGNDHLRGNPGYGSLFGANGDDRLDSGSVANMGNALYGNAGDDVLTASPIVGSNSQMEGGAGGDTFVPAAGGSDVRYDSAVGPLTEILDGVANDGEAGEGDNIMPGIAAVYGGHHGNTMVGDAGDNDLIGGDGTDSVSGGAGDDFLSGSKGDDAIDGGPGADFIEEGGEGTDDVRGGDGIDGLRTWSSDSDFVAPFRLTLDDVANDGGPGGEDNVHSDVENVETGPGNDTLVGSAKANSFFGYTGSDTLDGGGGADSLAGDDGDDTLLARDGVQDRIDCGTGVDIAIVDALDIILDGCETVQYEASPPPPPPPGLPLPPPLLPLDSDGDGLVDAQDACPNEDARRRDRNRNGCLDLRRLVVNFRLSPDPYVRLARNRRSYIKLGVKVRLLSASGIPVGASLRLTCTRGACKSTTVKVGRSGRIIFKGMHNRKLATGTRIEMRATLKGAVGAGARFTVRPNFVSQREFCIRPDGRRGTCSTIR